MTLTTDARHVLLVAELGDTPDGVLASMGAALWDAESAWAALPAVQEAAVKVRACDILLTFYRGWINRVLTDDERKTLELRLTSLEAAKAAALAAKAGALTAPGNTGTSAGAQVGLLTTTAPIAGPAGYPDPNDTRYLGDPYKGRWPW